jgi:hypothetical protein
MRPRRGAAALLVLAVLTTGSCSGSGSPSAESPTPSEATSPVELSCTGSVTTGPLPTWAQGGFEPPDQPVPHVIGQGGDIVGVVFGEPLHSPAVPDLGNKVLWVPRPDATADAGDSWGTELTIDARLNGVGTTATVTLAGGPGPSTLDMPAAGCWTMTLHWSGRSDTVALPYLA